MRRLSDKISAAQQRRVCYMSIFALAGFVTQLFTGQVVDAKIKDRTFEGPYLWEGKGYPKALR